MQLYIVNISSMMEKFKIHEEKPLGPFSEQGELMLHTATGDSCCHRDRVEVDLGLCSGLG